LPEPGPNFSAADGDKGGSAQRLPDFDTPDSGFPGSPIGVRALRFLSMSDAPQGSNPPQHHNVWRTLLTNPVTLGAIVTAYVALNTAIFGYLSARNSQRIEREKFEFQSSLEERKYETGLVLEIAKSAGGNQQLMLHRLCILAATGLIPLTAEKMQQQAKSCQAPDKP
jgi:hypothetical protein